MAFLAKRPEIATILISYYQTEYSNQYFNSEFDDGAIWNDKHTLRFI
jgi:Nicastrin